MSTVIGYKNKPLQIDINSVLNNGSTGAWIINGDNSITHNNNLGSYIDLPEDLVLGDTYRITYTVNAYSSCIVQAYLGSTAGTVHSATGTFQQVLVHTGPLKIRFYATGNVSINHYKLEHLATTVSEIPIDPTNSVEFENKSWTLSYNLALQQWLSYHSYLPNNYLQHPKKLITKRNDTQLKLTSSGDYGKYFDNDIKPFIIESVLNEYPTETKVFDNIQSCLETKFGEVTTNKFFDKALVYTEFQCSGEVILDLTNLTKKERNWNFNKFLDITNNLNQSIFVRDWNNVKTVYPIDKVVNTSKLDVTKPWYQRGRMRDKFMVVRFIENNAENNKIFCKFVSSYIRVSTR